MVISLEEFNAAMKEPGASHPGIDDPDQDPSNNVRTITDPVEEIREVSGHSSTSTATGSAILTGGGDSDAGSVTISPTRNTSDVGSDDQQETAERLRTSVQREQSQTQVPPGSNADNDVTTTVAPTPGGIGGLVVLLAVAVVGYIGLKEVF